MNLPFLLSIVATTIEMTTCFVCVSIMLHAKQVFWDRSRRILTMGSAFCGILAASFVLVSIFGIDEGGSTYSLMPPMLCLMFMAMHIVMTLYPISVIHPEWLNTRHFFYLFAPVAVLGFFYIHILDWTVIQTTQDIWENITELDVIIRLCNLLAMLPYCMILFLLPRKKRHKRTSFGWMVNFSLGLTLICVVHIVLMLTFNTTLLIILPLLAALFYFKSMGHELGDRLRPSTVEEEAVFSLPENRILEQETSSELKEAPMEPDLWSRVTRIMETEEAWRDPDLTLVSMAHSCATNVTYLNQIIRQETGRSFKEMVKEKRISCVVEQLKENPDTDIQAAFFAAGFRSRTTAWRNFKEIKGMSPQEFRLKLREQ